MSNDEFNFGSSGSPPPLQNPYSASPLEGPDRLNLVPLPPDQQRGMVGQTSVLGILMIIQGVLDCLVGVGAGIYAVVFPTLLKQIQEQPGAPPMGPQPQDMPLYMGVYLGVASAVLLIVGILNIVSGIGVMRLQRRGLAMTSLGLGMLTLMTCYCFPTSLALGIYGLIVLLNQPVSVAFELRRQGHSVNDIMRSFVMLP